MRPHRDIGSARAFILGGNLSTIAFITGLATESASITAHLVPVAHTPLGAVLGEAWQSVQVPLEGLLDWIDATFPADDEHAFIAPVRDIELLARINWQADPPAQLTEDDVLNIDDVPEEIAQALAMPPQQLVQCAACRRLCVREHFIWKERRLCAWDYHRGVFGRRGPWHTGPYEPRHFETVPSAAYVAPPLLEEAGAEIVLDIAGIEETVAQEAINLVLRAQPARAHMAVRTLDGYSLVRERSAPAAAHDG